MGEPVETRGVLDILLEGTARNVASDKPIGHFKVRRLSKERGCDVVFKLRALAYDQAVSISKSDGMDLDTVLAGVIDPSLRDAQLAQKLGVLEQGRTWADSAATPQELVKALLLPGEIAALSRAIQQLSGYFVVTLQEVKKN